MKADTEFWLSRWRENRIGFHRDGIQPLLVSFWDQVAGSGNGRPVLVPLCGKTHDLLWLAGRGHPVVGIDVSEIAARALFAEHDLEPRRLETAAPLERMSGGGIDFWIGDVFDLTTERVGRFPLVYDRAALIALPARTRPAYVSHIQHLLEKYADILLITVDYDPDSMDGPPYAVGETEVRDLYRDFHIEKLSDEDCLASEPRFRDRGLAWMREAAWHLKALV
jgi:thiopurine S-methyltransferase